MANPKINPSSFIPTGDMLRELANQSYVSDSDIKTILRQRGIFTPTNEKERTVSILSCLTLSSSEFEVLVERQSVKEDNLKSAGSGNIKLNSQFINLTTFIHEDYLPGLVENISPKNAHLKNNYKVIGRPIVKTITKDKEIEVEINIERNNYNKSWVNHKTQFKAIVRFKHTDDQIIFQRFFTSNETKNVVNQCVSFFQYKCKEKNIIDQQEQEHRVRFDDFDNTGRIIFFLKLFNSKEAENLKLIGTDISTFEFCPDTSLPLPPVLKWMNNKEEMIFRGKKVDETFFLTENKYYQNLIVWRMQATYKFELTGKGVSGKIKVDFNFHEYVKDKSQKAPLEVNLITALELDSGQHLTLTQKDDVKKTLLGMFENLKTTLYHNHFDPTNLL